LHGNFRRGTESNPRITSSGFCGAGTTVNQDRCGS
jgi:hypothetical protein